MTKQEKIYNKLFDLVFELLFTVAPMLYMYFNGHFELAVLFALIVIIINIKRKKS